ncbi:hypothetical protein EAH_00059910, partial [Eimeria acervulina]
YADISLHFGSKL